MRKLPKLYRKDGRISLPALDAISDVVLAYKPKPKSNPAKKRARRRKKAQT